MKVAFDQQIFTLQSYGGISRYIVRLADGLSDLGVEVHVVAPFHRNRYLRELQKGTVSGVGVGAYPRKTTRVMSLCNYLLARTRLKSLGPELVHETYYSSWPSTNRQVKTVVTVHDMIHEKFANEFPVHDRTTERKRKAVERADHIICISQNTKNDLCEIFDVPEKKVSVVYHGFDRIGDKERSVNLEPSRRPFLLYVGNRGGYKNFARMLEAIASSFRLKHDLDVVAFGGGAFCRDERRLIAELGFRSESVRQVSGGDQMLRTLYRTATALVYPSLYEGFGFPPLEAMAHNCPVAASNAGSMVEVIGNAGAYFDPTDSESLRHAMESVVYDRGRRDELVAEGVRNLSRFSWMQCARETRAIYREIVR